MRSEKTVERFAQQMLRRRSTIERQDLELLAYLASSMQGDPDKCRRH